MSNFLHVDMNSYFATILQQENPYLRGKPIGVVKELGRSCIIAASKEAKKMGVRTGCLAREAKILAPDILFVPAAFHAYMSTTHTLHALFRQTVPQPEIFSLDEAFLPIKDCRRLYPDPHLLGKQIQQHVYQELGSWVTCNVGIGSTRFLAKLASEIAPKGSVFEITPQNQLDVFATTPFSQVCGIGYRLEKKLAQLGITNLLLLDMCPDEQLEPLLGKWWLKELRKMTSGEETHFLANTQRPGHMKSVGRSITGYSLCKNEADILRVLRNLVEEVTFKCRRMHLAGRRISVMLWGSWREKKPVGWGMMPQKTPFWSMFQTMKTPIDQAQDMYDCIREWVVQRPEHFPVIKFAVGLSLLESYLPTPQPLFPAPARARALTEAMDTINEKYGLFTVRPGVLQKTIIRPEVTGYLGDKKYQLAQV